MISLVGLYVLSEKLLQCNLVQRRPTKDTLIPFFSTRILCLSFVPPENTISGRF